MRTTIESTATAARVARRHERGQGLVELAFIFPVVALLWIGFIDLARIQVKQQQAMTAIDAMSLIIASQPKAMSVTEIVQIGCHAIAETGMLVDMHKTEADCVSGGWVKLDPAVDDPSSPGQTVYPVRVEMTIPVLIVTGFKLIDGTQYKSLASYDFKTPVHYIRPNRTVLGA